MKKPLITIDGPAGAGKSTVCQTLARRLGFTCIDTGALYRGVAFVVKQSGCDIQNDEAIQSVCHGLDLKISSCAETMKLFNHDEELTHIIREPEISMLASTISAKPIVREYLLTIQRKIGQQGGVIFEGRDMGTIVFPNADIKFFLDADHHIRAERRFKELSQRSLNTSLNEVAHHMKQRDDQDKNRSVAPLIPAEDAIHIDCSQLSIDEVIAIMIENINNRTKIDEH